MANQTISNPLKRSITGGHIATVEDIAYSTKTAGSGTLAYETIDVSLKTKLDALASSLDSLNTTITGNGGLSSKVTALESKTYTVDDIKYNASTTLAAKLTAIETEIENLSPDVDITKISYSYEEEAEDGSKSTKTYTLDKYLDIVRTAISQIVAIDEQVEAATNAKNAAIAAKDEALDAQEAAETALTAAEAALTAAEAAQTATEENVAKLNDLKSIADDLVASYDSDLQLVVCESDYYENLSSTTNAIYFLL